MNILKIIFPFKFYFSADNYAFTPGSGGTAAAEERSSVLYPIVLVAGYASGGQGSKVSTTPGTPVQLSASSVPTRMIRITAFEGNTDTIVIGFSTAVRAGATGGAPAGARTGISLTPLQSYDCPASNLNIIYLDVITSGDGVHYGYLN